VLALKAELRVVVRGAGVAVRGLGGPELASAAGDGGGDDAAVIVSRRLAVLLGRRRGRADGVDSVAVAAVADTVGAQVRNTVDDGAIRVAVGDRALATRAVALVAVVAVAVVVRVVAEALVDPLEAEERVASARVAQPTAASTGTLATPSGPLPTMSRPPSLSRKQPMYSKTMSSATVTEMESKYAV